MVAVGRLTLLSALLFALLALAVPAAHAQATPETPLGSPAERIVAFAQQELARGVYETPMGSNRGKRIRLYGKATQESLRYYPAPWCAYFVSWVTLQAGVPIGWNALGDGYVPRIADWAKRVGLWRRSPKPGDLIVFPQHIGIVDAGWAAFDAGAWADSGHAVGDELAALGAQVMQAHLPRSLGGHCAGNQGYRQSTQVKPKSH